MKITPIAFLAMAAAVVGTSSSFASTESPDNPTSANLASLNYYPHRGNLLVEPSYDSNINTQTNGSRISRNEFVLSMNYGLPWIDGLRLAVEGNDTVGTHTIGGHTFSHTGVGDPTISALYRLLDDTPGGFSVDTELSFTPSMASSDVAYMSQPGGNGGGRSILGLTAAGFWRLGLNEAAAGAEVSRFFSGTETDPMGLGNEISLDSRWLATAALRDRIHILPTLFVQGEAQFNFANTQKVSVGSGPTTESDYPFNVSPTLGLGFLAKKDVLLTLYFQYQGYDVQLPDASTSSSYVSSSFGFHAWIEL